LPAFIAGYTTVFIKSIAEQLRVGLGVFCVFEISKRKFVYKFGLAWQGIDAIGLPFLLGLFLSSFAWCLWLWTLALTDGVAVEERVCFGVT